MEYAGILWGVDGRYYYLYADENGYMVLAPMDDVMVQGWAAGHVA